MKTRMPFLIKHVSLLLLLLLVLLTGCSLGGRIYEKYDQVQAARRYELDLNYRFFERRSPMLNMEQTIVKEVTPKGRNCTVYDALVLNSLSYQVKDELFIIIDDEVFKPAVTSLEYDNSREIQEKSEEVMRADSSTVKVVTGYTENNKKITRFSYSLDTSMIDGLRNATTVLLRYYAGPDMITIKLKGLKLKKLKKLIEKD
ncbi:MAG: hypothetical protein PHE04_04535 [Bacteroidales bacterium]|nr:hypothetical protein [Bacteroidales bacterium]MDD4362141.1 hypothetical protein [Bacteroidales bacterium]